MAKPRVQYKPVSKKKKHGISGLSLTPIIVKAGPLFSILTDIDR